MMPITATRTRSSVRLKPRLSFHKRRDRRRNPGRLIDTIPSLGQARRVPACATFSTPRFFETLHERSHGLANYWASLDLRFDTSFATLRHSCLALPGPRAFAETRGEGTWRGEDARGTSLGPRRLECHLCAPTGPAAAPPR